MASVSSLKPDGDISIEPPGANTSLNVQNMADLLRTGTHSQKTVILFEVSQMFTHASPGTLPIIVEAICSCVHDWSEDLQIAAAEALLDVCKECKESSEDIVSAALAVITSKSVSEDVYESWGEILVRVVPTTELQGTELAKKLIELLNVYSSNESKVHRKLAARLFGSISPCLTSEQVESDILEQVLKLADDRDTDVRGMLAESLAFVGAATSAEVTSNRVWPTIWGLLQDSDTRIRAVTLRAVSNILDAHRKKGIDIMHFSKLLYPVFLKEAAQAKEIAMRDLCGIDEVAFVMLLIVSQVFGNFAYSCAPHFTNDDEKDAIFQSYRRMATCNSAGIRRYCAYNLPGVSLIFGEVHHAYISRIFLHLLNKGSIDTRIMLASGIRETVAALGKAGAGTPTIETLFNSVLVLLQDRNPVVQLSMAKYIISLLNSLGASIYIDGKSGEPNRKDAVFQALKTMAAGNWRAQEVLVKEIESDTPRITPTALKQYILPLLYQLAEESPYLVRKSAMLAIARAIWHLPRMHFREEVMQGFRIEWGESSVYWMRMAFIESAEAAMNIYSKELFRELYLGTLFHLADDAVPNVRMKVAKVIPILSKFCGGSEEFKQIVESLKMDGDIDVRYFLQGIDGKLEELEGEKETFEKENEERMKAETKMLDDANNAPSKPVSPSKKRMSRKKPAMLTTLETSARGSIDYEGGASPKSGGSSPTISKLRGKISAPKSPRAFSGRGITPPQTPENKKGTPSLKLAASDDGGDSNADTLEEENERQSSGKKGFSKRLSKLASIKKDTSRPEEDFDAITSPVTPSTPTTFGFKDEDSKKEEVAEPSGSGLRRRLSSISRSAKILNDGGDSDKGGGTLKKKSSFSRLLRLTDTGEVDGGGSSSSAATGTKGRQGGSPSSPSSPLSHADGSFMKDKTEEESMKLLTPRHRSFQSMWRDIGKVKKQSNRSVE